MVDLMLVLDCERRAAVEASRVRERELLQSVGRSKGPPIEGVYLLILAVDDPSLERASVSNVPTGCYHALTAVR